MSEKTYQGKTMKEALAKVRKDLGGDAVILALREVHRRRLFGIGPRELIEVKASATMPTASRSQFRESEAPAERRFSVARQEARPPRMGQREPGRIDREIADLAAELLASYSRLRELEVPELLARRLVQSVADILEPDQASDPRAIEEALCQTVEQCLAIAPPCRAVPGTRRIVALVGPTGVGKTTTVAKLAATFKLVGGPRAGLVTVDTYRIAAVEQLKTYAEIIDLPLTVVQRPAEMRQALDALGAVDLVFIDTAGRSPRDEGKIRELEDFLAQARPDEVHLVLSAAGGEQMLRSAVRQFRQVGVDRLILTKLDEAQTLGGVLGMLDQASLPVSYLTTGQAVPDDIEHADRKRLARLILGLEAIG